METYNDYQKFDKDMFKLTNILRNRLDRVIDERGIADSFEEYQKSFNNFDKTNNQK
jgi:hypothetical protein